MAQSAVALARRVRRRAWMGATLYVIVALIWLIPDRRIEKILSVESGASKAS